MGGFHLLLVPTPNNIHFILHTSSPISYYTFSLLFTSPLYPRRLLLSCFILERPQTQWTKERLPELLKEVSIPVEDGSIHITSVPTLDGDATINVRKGKRIITYELKLTAHWKGSYGKDADAKKASGKIVMPYICEDVDDFLYESLHIVPIPVFYMIYPSLVQVETDKDDDASHKMKDAINSHKDLIYKQFETWRQELHDKPLQ